ncbi:unnamed protein product, partial [Rangifer tarandus platyrhynchus]
SMDGAALTETDQQGAGWEGLGSSKEMRSETQVEFQEPLPCQGAVRPEATDPLTSNEQEPGGLQSLGCKESDTTGGGMHHTLCFSVKCHQQTDLPSAYGGPWSPGSCEFCVGRGLQREKAGEAEEREDWVGEGRQNFPGSLCCVPAKCDPPVQLPGHVQTTACQLAHPDPPAAASPEYTVATVATARARGRKPPPLCGRGMGAPPAVGP